MLTVFHATPTFSRTQWPAAIVRSSDSSRQIAGCLRTVRTELLEGIAAHYRYVEMMRQGIPPDKALSLALGISHAGSGVCSQVSKARADMAMDDDVRRHSARFRVR